MFGKHHTAETKKKIGELRKGKSVSVETKLKIGLSRVRERNKKVFVYLKDHTANKNIFFKSFDNYLETAKNLNCSYTTVKNYINTNKLLKKK